MCKIREINDTERRFTFEIVSPKCRHILQADSQRECTLWVKTIDKAINEALNNCNNLKVPANSNLNNSGGGYSYNNNNNSGTSDGNNGVQQNGNHDDSSFNEINSEFFDSIEFFNMMSHESMTRTASNGNLSSFRNNSYKSLKELEMASSSANNNNINGNNNNNNRVLSLKDERIERKNYILTTVKGNQNCCDCGAPNPTWVTNLK